MTITKTEGVRKKGRPARYGQGRTSLHVRFTPERIEMLKALADLNGRSLSEQVEYVVERHFADQAVHAAKRNDRQLRDVDEKRTQEIIEATTERLLAQVRELFAGRKE